MRAATVSRLGVLLILLLRQADGLLCAQELMFNGVGPVNHSLAGAAVALPRDSAGAIQWNPATISFLEQSEFQLGMGRHNAPWYGDEFVVGTIGVAVVVALWIYTAVDDKDDQEKERRQKQYGDEWIVIDNGWLAILIHDSSPDYSRPPSAHRQESATARAPKQPKIRVPTFSYVYNKNRHWSYGLAISEYGAQKVGALAVGDMVGICEYRFQGYEFIPTVSYRESKRFSMGFSPIFSIDETPNASLPVIFSRYSDPTQNQRSQAGIGLQGGIYYTPNQRLRFGASVRTPQWISRYTYRWTDPITGEPGTQHLSFSQDSSFRIALGTSYTFRNDKTTIATDFRYDDYSHASALYDIPASFDPEVTKQGIARAAYSLASGVEYRPRDIIALRMGYRWNHAVTPEKSVIYNTSLPIQSGHSIHYGVTFFFSEIFDLSFSSSNSFGGGWETLAMEEGSIRFRRNPNRSNFWAAARLRF